MGIFITALEKSSKAKALCLAKKVRAWLLPAFVGMGFGGDGLHLNSYSVSDN